MEIRVGMREIPKWNSKYINGNYMETIIAETINGLEYGNIQFPIIGNCSTFHVLGM